MPKGVNFQFTATNKAKGAMHGVQRDLQGIQRHTRQTMQVQQSWNRGLNANRRAVQQLGFQVSDFAIQVSGGQSAMLAFVQQGGQILQFFGPLGATAAALLAIFGSMAIAFVKSGHALSELIPLTGVLEEDFRAIGTVLASVGDAMLTVANLIVNNLDTIVIAIAIVVGWIGTKWVIAMVAASSVTSAFIGVLRAAAVSYHLAGAGAAAATVATSVFTGALRVLRAVLISLGLPALIIAAAILVERFLALSQAAGGWGNALGLLADVAKEVFERIGLAMSYIPVAMRAAANKMAAWFIEKLADMSFHFLDFMADVTDGFNTIFGTNLKPMGGGMDVYMRGVASSFREAGSAASKTGDEIKKAMTAPLTSIEKIRELVKETKIDLRDLFGGGTEGDGGDSAASRAKKEADRIEKIFKDMQKSISDSMLSGFKALFDGSKSFGDAARDILGNILDNVIDLLMTPIFNSIAGAITGGILGGLGGIASFDGGGSTGIGARAGGLDGKGGRLAMVHPNETVVDHTKGQSTGGVTINMNISTPDVQGFRRSKRQIANELKAAMG